MTAAYRALTATLALAACSVPTGPGPTDGPLRLEAAIEQPTLAIGDTTHLVFRLVNTSNRPVTLSFGSSCQVLPYIRVAESGEFYYPIDGGYACLTVLTGLTIPANHAHVIRVLLQGGAPQIAIHTGIPMEAGRYVATAEVNSTEYHLRSAPVAFTVR